MFPFSRSSNHLQRSWDPSIFFPILVFSNTPESMLFGRFPVLPEPQRIPSCRTENMILSGSKVWIQTSKPKIFHAKQNLGPLLCVRRSPLLQRGCYIQHPMHLQKKTSTSGIKHSYLEPQTTIYKRMFQLDDSKSLHEKWLFHQTSIYKGLALGFQVIIHPETELATLRAIMLWRDPSTPIENQLTRKAWGNPQK